MLVLCIADILHQMSLNGLFAGYPCMEDAVAPPAQVEL